MFQLICLCWNSENLGSNTSEGMPQHRIEELPSMSEGQWEKARTSFSHFPFCRLPPGVAQIQAGSSDLKWFRLREGLHTQMIQSREPFTAVPSYLGFN